MGTNRLESRQDLNTSNQRGLQGEKRIVFNRKIMDSKDQSAAKAIGQKVLRALSSNRAPGFHFAGYYLGFKCERFEKQSVEFSVPDSPYCQDAQGHFSRSGVLFLADMMLAASNRVHLNGGVRTATMVLHVEFTGAPAIGPLVATGRGFGFVDRTALPEGRCEGRVIAQGQDVLRVSGTWVSPPAPRGMVMHGLPWEGGVDGSDWPLLKKNELDANEKTLVSRVNKLLRRAPAVDLLGQLWDPQVKRTASGAVARLPVGMHVSNRVGHVQGGLLLNMAVCSAQAAVPEHPLITEATAWYISPGQGKVIRARSTVLQKGRNVAVVRTELFGEAGKRVLETISNHAVPAPRSV
jgi:hypothetical protein